MFHQLTTNSGKPGHSSILARSAGIELKTATQTRIARVVPIPIKEHVLCSRLYLGSVDGEEVESSCLDQTALSAITPLVLTLARCNVDLERLVTLRAEGDLS